MDIEDSGLLKWYDENKRPLPWRDEESGASIGSPYSIWICEVMSQQTRMQTVLEYHKRWMNKWPTVAELANATEEEVQQMWMGLGYYRRVKNILAAAKKIVSDFNGEIPNNVQDLLKLPGIGQYTAGAIASIGFGVRVPAIDGNVERVISRIHALDADEFKKKLRDYTIQYVDHDRPGDSNQALMEIGATVCLPPPARPLCSKCPFSDRCKAKLTDPMLYPVKTKKKPEKRLVYAVSCIVWKTTSDKKRFFLLEQRPETGLLASLWLFPFVECHKEDNQDGKKGQIETYLKEKGVAMVNLQFVADTTYLFTHIRQETTVFQCEAEFSSDEARFRWVLEGDLTNTIPTVAKRMLSEFKGKNKKSRKRKVKVKEEEETDDDGDE